MCANSLVPLDTLDSIAFGEDPEFESKLQLIRDKYFSTQSLQKKVKLRLDYSKLVKEEESIFGESTRTSQLKTYSPFETNTASAFFDAIHMFGVDKFDVVIANPPYVSALVAKRSTPEEVRESYKKNYQSANGAYDIYLLFFELGFNLLKLNGLLVYITPRKYLSALYGESFRNRLGSSRLKSIVDFSDDRVFESAGVSTMISIYQNSNQVDPISVKIFSNAEMSTLEHSVLHDRETLNHFPQGSWGFLISKDYEFLLKAHSSKILFEDVLGVNSSSTAAEADDYKSAISEAPSLFKMVNTGNLGPWVTKWDSVLYSNGKQKLTKPFIEVSAINARRFKMFKSEKIIIGKLAKQIIASIDHQGEFASSNTTFVYNFSDKYSIWFIGAILNTKFINRVYRAQFAGLNLPGDSYQYQAPQIRLLPLPIIDEKNLRIVNEVEKLAKQIVLKREEGIELQNPIILESLVLLENLVEKIYFGIS